MTWWASGNAPYPMGAQAREATRPDRRLTGTSRAGVGPAPSQIFIGRFVIVFGTTGGIFLYNGQPVAGNPPVLWAVPPGVTSDPYGNAVTAVLGIGTPGGPGAQFDAVGDLTLTGPDASSIALMPEANLPFTLTGALSGVMQTIMDMKTLDASETQAGVVSGIVLGSGSSAKESTLVMSPYAAEGMGLLLQAQNDGATDVPYATFGTVVTTGGVVTFTPSFALAPGLFVMYSGGGTITVVTHTSGSGTIPIPVGVTSAKGECWGAGAALAGVSGGPSALGGCGGGAYAAEPALVVPSGGTVAYSVPASSNSLGGSPPDCTLAGSVVTVTAHSGQGGTTLGAGNGGAAGSNTVAFAGARGGAPSAQDPGGGGGGGGSAGPSSAGNHGTGGSPTAGGSGGGAVSGGGGGGKGGTPTGNGAAGTSPGGGGGGGSTNASGAVGGAGQVRLTYSSGAPGVLMSVASAATTDQFGTSIPAGTILPGPADGNQYNAGPNIVALASTFTINSTSPQTIMSHAVGVGTYKIEAWMNVANTTAADGASFAFSGPAAGAPVLMDWINTSGTNPAAVTHNASGTYTTANTNQGVAGSQQVIMRATVKFTAAGTLAVTGAEAVTGNTVTVGAGSRLEITPVVAT